MGDQAIVVINDEKQDPDIFPCEYAQYTQYAYNHIPKYAQYVCMKIMMQNMQNNTYKICMQYAK